MASPGCSTTLAALKADSKTQVASERLEHFLGSPKFIGFIESYASIPPEELGETQRLFEKGFAQAITPVVDSSSTDDAKEERRHKIMAFFKKWGPTIAKILMNEKFLYPTSPQLGWVVIRKQVYDPEFTELMEIVKRLLARPMADLETTGSGRATVKEYEEVEEAINSFNVKRFFLKGHDSPFGKAIDYLQQEIKGPFILFGTHVDEMVVCYHILRRTVPNLLYFLLARKVVSSTMIR